MCAWFENAQGANIFTADSSFIKAYTGGKDMKVVFVCVHLARDDWLVKLILIWATELKLHYFSIIQVHN